MRKRRKIKITEVEGNEQKAERGREYYCGLGDDVQ